MVSLDEKALRDKIDRHPQPQLSSSSDLAQRSLMVEVKIIRVSRTRCNSTMYPGLSAKLIELSFEKDAKCVRFILAHGSEVVK
jgi:hypothetical protein